MTTDEQEKTIMTTPLTATIPGTEVRTIKSNHANQEYRISVALPFSYLSKPRKRYPTIYLTDANLNFGMVTELTRVMSMSERFPETIVVGIGYPLDGPLDTILKQFTVLRSRDLTPVVDKKLEEETAKWLKVDRVRTGGAARFLQFIKTELIPVIEAEFRSNSTDRILAGHSSGGLFVLYTLFHQPKLFKGFVAGSPSLWFGDKVTFKYENQFAKSHKALPVKLYLGVGELEESSESHSVSNTLQFAALLESRKYTDFSLIKQIIGSCDHFASVAPTHQAGLQAVLI